MRATAPKTKRRENIYYMYGKRAIHILWRRNDGDLSGASDFKLWLCSLPFFFPLSRVAWPSSGLLPYHPESIAVWSIMMSPSSRSRFVLNFNRPFFLILFRSCHPRSSVYIPAYIHVMRIREKESERDEANRTHAARQAPLYDIYTTTVFLYYFIIFSLLLSSAFLLCGVYICAHTYVCIYIYI